MTYIVEMHIGNGWENVWQLDDQPHTFATREEAEAELSEHFEDMQEAGMEFNPDEYRIEAVEVAE